MSIRITPGLPNIIYCKEAPPPPYLIWALPNMVVAARVWQRIEPFSGHLPGAFPIRPSIACERGVALFEEIRRRYGPLEAQTLNQYVYDTAHHLHWPEVFQLCEGRGSKNHPAAYLLQ